MVAPDEIPHKQDWIEWAGPNQATVAVNNFWTWSSLFNEMYNGHVPYWVYMIIWKWNVHRKGRGRCMLDSIPHVQWHVLDVSYVTMTNA